MEIPRLTSHRDGNKGQSMRSRVVTLGLAKLPQLHYSHTIRWGVVVTDGI